MQQRVPSRVPAWTVMLLLAVCVPRTLVAESNPESARERPFGTPMVLTFVALKANQEYSVSFESGTTLTGESKGAPAGLRLEANQLRYTPTADVPSVTFTVGALLWSQDMTWNVHVPAPAAVVISIPKALIQHTVVTNEAHAQVRLHTDVKAPDGCLIALDCTLDNACPLDPKRPLKCYGPVVSSFYCCWRDPF